MKARNLLVLWALAGVQVVDTLVTHQAQQDFPVLLSSDAELEVATFLNSQLAAPAADTHPFWIFEWDKVTGYQVLWCCITLFLAGLLCSAGGIGGGGVYVTVLMIAGQLTPRDAVPLSKAVVFSGAITTLFQNIGRTLVGRAGPAKTVIDYNICRIVVPSALIGTLLGVLLNRSAADDIIVVILSAVLVLMSAMVCYTTYQQYTEEEKELASACGDFVSGLPASGHGGETSPEATTGAQLDMAEHMKETPTRQRDACMGIVMLTIVVLSGVIRHHASACLWEIDIHSSEADRAAACEHPVLEFLLAGRASQWMANPLRSGTVMFLTLLIPMTVTFAIMVSNGAACILYEGWTAVEVAQYECMGVATGCLAGLVGIGGGLVFSPFFLVMGIEPMIAVATSSTCVIFTSSSTTLQYLLTDRIIMSLACVYGLVNIAASYCGTAFVHFLQDRFAARRSYITAIVAAGVLVSAVLSLAKLGEREEAVADSSMLL